MTTKHEFLEGLKEWISYKKQEYEEESNEEAMQWQEDADNSYSEFYEIAKDSYDEILKRKGDIDGLIEEIESFLANK